MQRSRRTLGRTQDQIELSKTLPDLADIAAKLLSMHATSCSPERIWSCWRHLYRPNRSSLHYERAEKMLVVSSAAKLLANDMRSEEDMEQELDLAALWSKEDDV